MKQRRSAKPARPVDIALRRAAARAQEAAQRADPSAWGADATALALPANADVELRLAGKAKVARARRLDLFDSLAKRGALPRQGLEAVRRLQDDVARLHAGDIAVVQLTPRVDASRRPQAPSDHALRAGARITAALDLAGALNARLLRALIEPEASRGAAEDWRAVVARETGETAKDAQGAVVRAACENLAEAYRRLDRERRG